MSVIYKVVELSSNPLDQKAPKRYYPRAVTLGQSVNLNFLTERISGNSSLSKGDVLSVIQNFVEKLKEQLLEGKTVNVAGLGVFSLSLKSKGEEKPEEVKAKSVSSVRICFQAAKGLRITKTTSRSGEKLDLIRLDDYIKGEEEEKEKNPIEGDDDPTDPREPEGGDEKDPDGEQQKDDKEPGEGTDPKDDDDYGGFD